MLSRSCTRWSLAALLLPLAQDPAPVTVAELSGLDDGSLRAAFEGAMRWASYHGSGADVHDGCLLEMIERGPAVWEGYLESALSLRRAAVDSAAPIDLEVLTALRRIRGERAPLEVEVGFGPRATEDAVVLQFPELPTLHVRLRNVDAGRDAFGLTDGGEYRSGRLARWRVDVRGADGTRVPQDREWPLGVGGGLFQRIFLAPGQVWGQRETEERFVDPEPLVLAFRDYASLPAAGTFRFSLLYHDHAPIADLESVEHLLVHRSRELRVTWKPRTVRVTAADRARVRQLLGEMSLNERVHVRSRPFDGRSTSEPGADPEEQLFRMGWSVLPELFAALEDEDLGLAQRAHVLAALHGITGLVNPRVVRRSLGPFRQDGLARGQAGGGLTLGATSGDDGGPQAEAQEALVERWRGYVDLIRVE
ncbi:MAG: hypothetical protein GY711_11100 [bacterium]|nr:hypothetical protein [bacterium]